MLPFLDNPDRKSLHTLWSREIYRFLRDFFSTVAMGPATAYDEFGNPEITKQEGTGVGWVIPYGGGGGDETVYGFQVRFEPVMVDDEEETHVVVATGTAQAWGLPVKVYSTADLGEVAAGFVYARLSLVSEPPAWDNALHFGSMTGQDPDEEIWVPIAEVSGSASDGWNLVQLHWGNIVIPAVTTAVDVQTMPPQ